MSHRITRFILTLSCPDQPGIVAAVSGSLAEAGCNITDSAQFGDPASGTFFMRVSFSAPPEKTIAALRKLMQPVFKRFDMKADIHDVKVKPRLLIMVSKFGHCLNDLLYRHRIGALPVEIPLIVSNHKDFYQLAASHNIPYYHLPVTTDTKAKQEARLTELAEENSIDLIVLARYMQVLSPEMCERFKGRIINIHHSFLPSFKGARPYHQAHERGVKLIGATAHYVTDQLDEGPIIEQEVARVDHAMDPNDIIAVGRDVESLVLARAVKWHVEHRVLMNGTKTIVFR